jgi:hypothetical protein
MALADVYWQALDAQIRYYRTVGRLTGSFARALFGNAPDVAPPLRVRERLFAGSSDVAVPALPEPSPAVIVLESEAGGYALGMFLVENSLPAKVSVPVEPSRFIDSEGREIRPRLRFDPGVITLKPGEQTLVKVAAAFDETFNAGVDYRGTVSIPRLSSKPIGVVLRRREGTLAGAQSPRNAVTALPAMRNRRRRPRVLDRAKGSRGA